ncbi:MAG: GNAT family N-acetyltransferase [Saprospiraceae bacterium]
MEINTPRTLLRPMSLDDLDFYFQLQSNAELMQYIRPPETDRENVRGRLEEILRYQENHPGLGAYVIIDKSSGELVGNCVIRHLNMKLENEMEVGYLVVKEHWGKGYATEATKALIDFAFTKLNAPCVQAVIHEENIASRKVLEKNGMVQTGTIAEYSPSDPLFELSRAKWEQDIQ